MDDITQKELYRIFNKVLSESSLLEYEKIDKEILIFSKKANQKRQENLQLDIFEEPPATSNEIKNVLNFCETLKAYYKEMDKDSYITSDLSENFYRIMYTELEQCRAYVSEENKEQYNAIKKNIQRNLPEYRGKIIIEDYIKEAEKIYKIRQKVKKSKEDKQSMQRFCEEKTVHFFNDIKKDSCLRQMEYCPEMLILCEKVLQIVDCLPQNMFGRIKKFKMKKNINKSREDIAKSLGGAYEEVARIAIQEQAKYENAIRATEQYLEGFAKQTTSFKYKTKAPSLEKINQMAKDDWDYK